MVKLMMRSSKEFLRGIKDVWLKRCSKFSKEEIRSLEESLKFYSYFHFLRLIKIIFFTNFVLEGASGSFGTPSYALGCIFTNLAIFKFM